MLLINYQLITSYHLVIFVNCISILNLVISLLIIKKNLNIILTNYKYCICVVTYIRLCIIMINLNCYLLMKLVYVFRILNVSIEHILNIIKILKLTLNINVLVLLVYYHYKKYNQFRHFEMVLILIHLIILLCKVLFKLKKILIINKLLYL